MESLTKTFQISWNDIDANRHVANTAYAKMMIDTRMSFLTKIGWGHKRMIVENLGPVILSESFYYLKEIMPDEEITVSLELLGQSDNYKFLQFSHPVFNQEGELSVYGTLIFAWLDLKTRKLIEPPIELKKLIMEMPKSEKYADIAKEDLRNLHTVPYGLRHD